jgi:hypothetical protein
VGRGPPPLRCRSSYAGQAGGAAPPCRAEDSPRPSPCGLGPTLPRGGGWRPSGAAEATAAEPTPAFRLELQTALRSGRPLPRTGGVGRGPPLLRCRSSYAGQAGGAAPLCRAEDSPRPSPCGLGPTLPRGGRVETTAAPRRPPPQSPPPAFDLSCRQLCAQADPSRGQEGWGGDHPCFAAGAATQGKQAARPLYAERRTHPGPALRGTDPPLGREGGDHSGAAEATARHPTPTPPL